MSEHNYSNDPVNEGTDADDQPLEDENFTLARVDDQPTEEWEVVDGEPADDEPGDDSPRVSGDQHTPWGEFQEERYEQARVDPGFAAKEAIVVDEDDVDVKVPAPGDVVWPLDKDEPDDDEEEV